MSLPGADRVQRLFAAAVELPREERRAFVERESGSDGALREEVGSLLAHHESDKSFLETPAVLDELQAGGEALRGFESGSTPERIASYTIEGLLGEGGMGVVYRARQENPSRSVALKLIRPGCVTPKLLKRFEREAQLLGRLHHPGIAQIFEAGSAQVGGVELPFLAMELVRGEPITRHAQHAQLGLRVRLELVLDVCDALEHAHREGVLHRDLKPANVLIDTSSGRARPKLLDFGIARAADDTDAALLTDTGQIVGTLSYMSPEQAAGARESIDERSDVYALGVLAYELLTGRLPLEVGELSLIEAARVISFEEPPPASRFDAELAGDLDTILAKALEKDPGRRYASAAAFAADLRATLLDQPIRARPPSRLYRLRKFTRRNRTVVAGALAVFAVLCIGIVTTETQAVIAAGERDKAFGSALEARHQAAVADAAREQEAAERVKAVRERNRAAKVSEYFQHLLAAAVPGDKGPNALLVDVLEHAASGLPGSLAAAPEAEADVRATLGQSFERLGRRDEAEAQFRAALALCREKLPEDELRRVDIGGYLGALLLDRDCLAEAETLLVESAARLAELQGPSENRAVQVLMKLGRLRLVQGRADEAESMLRRGLELAREGTELRDENVASALGTLGQVAQHKGRLADAEGLQRGALKLQLELHGELHPAAVAALGNLACTVQLEGRLEEAERLHRQAVDLGARVQGERHPDQIARVNNLAGLLVAREAWPEALQLRKQVVTMTEEVLGHDHEYTLIARGNLAVLCTRTGEFAESERILRENLDIERERYGAGDVRALGTQYNLAKALRDAGKLDEALANYEALVESASSSLSKDDWRLGLFRCGMGVSLLSVHKYPEAEAALLEAHTDLARLLGPKHQHTRNTRRCLFDLYTAWGKPEKAESWR